MQKNAAFFYKCTHVFTPLRHTMTVLIKDESIRAPQNAWQSCLERVTLRTLSCKIHRKCLMMKSTQKRQGYFLILGSYNRSGLTCIKPTHIQCMLQAYVSHTEVKEKKNLCEKKHHPAPSFVCLSSC